MPKHQNQTAGLGLEELQDLLEEKRAELPYGYKLPYMQWYEDDFKSSDGVSEMSPLGRLMYRQLLAKAWVSKQAPYLPNDPRKLQRLADCPTDQDWADCRAEILDMFSESEDGERLFHPRQLTNYITQISKISACVEAGAKGGRPPKAKDNRSLSENNRPLSIEKRSLSETPIKITERLAKAFVSESQLELELELERDLEPELESELKPNPETGEDEDTDMKAEKQLQISCQNFFNKSPRLYDSTKAEIKRLEAIHKGSAVVRSFEEWADSVEGDLENPVAAFVKVADSLLRGESNTQKASKAPEVLSLTRALAYVSDGKVAFGDREKPGLLALSQEFTQAEIESVFKVWLEDQDLSDPIGLKFAGKNFVDRADALCYTARRKRQEKSEAEVVRESTKLRLQEEAESERAAAEAEKEKEADLFDPLAV